MVNQCEALDRNVTCRPSAGSAKLALGEPAQLLPKDAASCAADCG